MKKINTLLLMSAFTIASNSFGMESEETSSNQSINFDKLEQRRLQEQNNKLLQENNRLLRIIITQNHLMSLSQRPTTYMQADRYKQLDAIYKQFEDNYTS
jgi:hypothetical protein